MTLAKPDIDLEDFTLNRMRMSHIYQPVMIKTLLQMGGQASVEDIAKSLLTYDQSQIEYYTLRTKLMVGKVLTPNGNHFSFARLRSSTKIPKTDAAISFKYCVLSSIFLLLSE